MYKIPLENELQNIDLQLSNLFKTTPLGHLLWKTQNKSFEK